MNRFAHAVFCDDIRQEVGNKTSIIGIYKGKMFVPAFPLVIPKLCVVVSIVTPAQRPFTELKVKLLQNDKVLVDAPLTDPILGLQAQVDAPNRDEKQYTAEMALVLSPVPLDAPTTFKLRVETEDEELKAGGLEIELAASVP